MRNVTWLLAALVGIGSAHPARAATPDKLLPDDAHVVVSIKLKDLQATDFVRKYGKDWIQRVLDENPLAAEAAKQIGLDPAKDLDSVVVAARDMRLPFQKSLLGIALPSVGERLIILRGRFNVEQARSLLADLAVDNPDRVKLSTHDKWRLYAFAVGERPMVATFLTDDTFLVATNRQYVVDAVDRHLGKRSSVLDPALAAAIGRIDERCHAWVALGVPGRVKDVLAIIPPLYESVHRFQGVTIETYSGKSLSINFNVIMKDNVAANRLWPIVDQARLILAPLVAPNQTIGPVLADALASARSDVRDDTIVTRLEITPELMDGAHGQGERVFRLVLPRLPQLPPPPFGLPPLPRPPFRIQLQPDR